MNDTTTATDSAETVVGPDTQRAPVPATVNTADTADTASVPQDFDEFELSVRRMLGLEDASDGDLRLFHHMCQKSGLDPFVKPAEIYMIGRNTEVASYEPVDSNEPDGQKRKVVRWVMKYAVQVAIGGFRRRAREIADAMDIDYSQADPLWCGEDGMWKEVWTDKVPPAAAKFTVFRDGKAYSFVAHYEEFVQFAGRGADAGPTSFWKKMPRNQLRKCAEANAIQMAFPGQLGGLVLDVADQAAIIDSDGNSVATKRRDPERARGVAALRERAAQAKPAQDGPEQAVDTAAAETRKKWLNRMFALLNEGKVTDRGDQIVVISALTDRRDDPPAHRNELPDAQVRTVVELLHERSQRGDLVDYLNDLLNSHASWLADKQEAEAEAAAEARANESD